MTTECQHAAATLLKVHRVQIGLGCVVLLACLALCFLPIDFFRTRPTPLLLLLTVLLVVLSAVNLLDEFYESRLHQLRGDPPRGFEEALETLTRFAKGDPRLREQALAELAADDGSPPAAAGAGAESPLLEAAPPLTPLVQ